MSDVEDLWPVEPSDALADPRLPADQFSKIVALTVAIAQDPWLPGSRTASQGEPWRTVPIPDSGGIIEYAINEADQVRPHGPSMYRALLESPGGTGKTAPQGVPELPGD